MKLQGWKKWTLIVTTVIVVGVLTAGFFSWQFAKSQGLPVEYWQSYQRAQVSFDELGIPTIQANTWNDVIHTQGLLIASERLFQMDLIRRKASGRLSEWFGAQAFEYDKRVQLEDRLAIAAKSVAMLPASEREYCERFADGVNQFIDENPGRWGIEYWMLEIEPELWRCDDTLLVVLSMVDELTAFSDDEAHQYSWKRHMPAVWQDFLWPQNHPWNVPLQKLEGYSDRNRGMVPKGKHALPMLPITDEEKQGAKQAVVQRPIALGSNNWAWRGPTGAFLANDPHLGNQVPTIWYAMRLRVSADDWVVGGSIPGIPGIVIGRSPYFAWAFTNTGEDIDDFLLETIDERNNSYLVSDAGGVSIWENLRKKTFKIKVKGEDKPREVVGTFTHRGPVSKRRFLGEGMYSRQWLALRPGLLRIPSMNISQAKTLAELHDAADKMRLPAQNMLYATNSGDLGYRLTGTGVRRRVTGFLPQPAAEGEWLGLQPYDQRLRLFKPHDEGDVAEFATANSRIWESQFEHYWFSDDRAFRIKEVLGMADNHSRQTMEQLQLDTTSRFRKKLLEWVAAHAKPETEGERNLVSLWRNWDGSSRSNELIFRQSSWIEYWLSDLLLTRVRDAYVEEDDQQFTYRGPLKRAWMVRMMDEEQGLAAFGLTEAEVCQLLLSKIAKKASEMKPHSEANRWLGQHPFVDNAPPLIGPLFAVDETPQIGAHDLVLAEQVDFGPSLRMVWDMGNHMDSTWNFPVGQSGHITSPHYKDLQANWHQGKMFPVFPDHLQWNLAKSP